MNEGARFRFAKGKGDGWKGGGDGDGNGADGRFRKEIESGDARDELNCCAVRIGFPLLRRLLSG